LDTRTTLVVYGMSKPRPFRNGQDYLFEVGAYVVRLLLKYVPLLISHTSACLFTVYALHYLSIFSVIWACIMPLLAIALTVYQYVIIIITSSSLSIVISGSEAHKTRQTDKPDRTMTGKMLKTYRNKKHRQKIQSDKLYNSDNCQNTDSRHTCTTKRLLQQFCRRE